MKDAPLSLIYVADYSKMEGTAEADEVKQLYTFADSGFIVQNVYLYCASEGYASVVLVGVNRDEMTKKMNLSGNQKIILSQCVGYLKE